MHYDEIFEKNESTPVKQFNDSPISQTRSLKFDDVTDKEDNEQEELKIETKTTTRVLPQYRTTMNQTFSESIANSLKDLEQDIEQLHVKSPEPEEFDRFSQESSELAKSKRNTEIDMQDPWSPESESNSQNL